MRISDWSSDVCSSDLVARKESAVAGGELLALLGPVVAGDSRLAATASHCRGFLGMADQMLDRPRDGARVGGIHQESAAGRLHDLAPMPEVGGDNRPARRHIFEQLVQIGSATCRERVCQYIMFTGCS